MQGKLAIAILLTAFGPGPAIAGEQVRRQGCPTKTEQTQQRQQQVQQQQQRAKPKGCQIQHQRTVPPAVDPTPIFFL